MYTYKVYNLWGKLLAEGTTKECAAKVNLTVSGFRKAVERMRDGHTGRLVIKEYGTPRRKEEQTSEESLAAQWDAFITPIREQYGVPVYKGKGEAGG